MPLYSNLPGIELTVKDGNLVLPPEDYGTKRVLIIAPKSDTPSDGALSYTPQRVDSSETFAQKGFGTFDKNNPLARLWKQVHDAGCRDIYLLELKGSTKEAMYANLHSLYSVLEENFYTDIILLGGVFVDDTINTSLVDLSATPREDYIAASNLAVAKSTPVTETFNTEGTTELQLTSPVIISSIVVEKDDGVQTTTLAPETDYTVDAETRKITLVNAIQTGETITVSYSTYDYNFGYQLAGFCAIVSGKNHQVIGVAALKEIDHSKVGDLAEVNTYINSQVTQKYNQYLQVVGGAPLYFEIANEPYLSNFSGAYAGMISVLPSYSSPTNKQIPGALFPAFNLSPTQVTNLINKHIVVHRSRNGKVVVADAITTAADDSDFVRLTTVRIVNDAVQLIREIAEPYIGEPNTLARRNSLETAIRTALNGMIRRGALNDFRFTIKASIADQIDGNMRIVLDLVPAFETRRIFVTVALKPTLE